jgi:hypothetical protein
MKHFQIKNGKWQIGNLYDTLVACKFDFFVNTHRQMFRNRIRVKITNKHNYVYNYKNI